MMLKITQMIKISAFHKQIYIFLKKVDVKYCQNQVNMILFIYLIDLWRDNSVG